MPTASGNLGVSSPRLKRRVAGDPGHQEEVPLGVMDMILYEDRIREIRTKIEDPRHIVGRVIAPPDGAPVLDGMTYLRDVPWLLELVDYLIAEQKDAEEVIWRELGWRSGEWPVKRKRDGKGDKANVLAPYHRPR